MNHDDAQDLVRTFFAMFPRSRTTDETLGVYAASLCGYEAGVLSRAMTSLSQKEEYLPSLAKIHARVQALDQAPASSAFERKPDKTCRTCRGSGWVDDVAIVREHEDGRRRLYSAVRPCPCRGGAPVANAPWDRDAFPEAVQSEVSALEFALGAPLNDAALRLVARDLDIYGAERALCRLRAAAILAKHASNAHELAANLFSNNGA